MATEQKAPQQGLTNVGKAVACIAVLMSGAFIIVKSNRSAAAAPIAEAGSLGEYHCPIQPTGDGVAIPDLDARCL